MTATFISSSPLQYNNMGNMLPINWKDQLYEAVTVNNLTQIETLANRGCNLETSIGPENMPALSYACAQTNNTDNKGLAWFLLGKNLSPDGNRDMVDFGTPLMQATLNRHVSLMEELLQKGAVVHTRAEDILATPLYQALLKGFFDGAKVLLDNGAYDAETIEDVLGLLTDPQFTEAPGNDERIKGIKALMQEFSDSQKTETSQQALFPYHAIIP